MNTPSNHPSAKQIRVLVADHEPQVLDTYRDILQAGPVSPVSADLSDLRPRLFGTPKSSRTAPQERFEVVFCRGAEDAVQAVQQALDEGKGFDVVFLDMRMPPGPDGLWAAGHIRDSNPGGGHRRGHRLLRCQPGGDRAARSAGGEISGVEALLRWQSAELGPVSPVDFIPLAEQTGLILPIGDWMLRTACAQCKAWRDQGLKLPRIAVNISVRQFAQAGFPEYIATAVIAMAESMHLKVTAEGVETANQLQFPSAQHCGEAQGYYLSRPLSEADASRFLRKALAGNAQYPAAESGVA